MLLFTSAYSGDIKCRALALSGGGDKGSYEAAVYIELVNLLDPEEVAYDVLTGVSAGSMNACGLGAFAPNEGVEASEFVFGLWNSIKSSDVFGMWPKGIIDGLFNQEGILNNKPLIDFVNSKTQGRTVKRKVTFALADANNAEYVNYDYDKCDTIPPDYVESAIGSSAIPFAFPHIHRDGRTLVDGGSIWNLDISSAVRRCREIVDDDKDIIIDTVSCSNYEIKREDVNKFSALEHYMRAREIKSFYGELDEIQKAKMLFPDVTFRYSIAPSEVLSSSPIPLDFSKEHLDTCFKVGEKDAKAAVDLGEGGYLEALLELRERKLNSEQVSLNEIIDRKLMEKAKLNPQSS
jgi:predicted patatin/cPLA2 family phospholipase